MRRPGRSLKVPSTKNEHQTHHTANIMEGITVTVMSLWCENIKVIVVGSKVEK